MTFYTVAFLEIVLDILGLCLCGMAAAFLIRMKRIRKPGNNRKKPNEKAKLFSDEMRFQMMRQHSHDAYAKISDALDM